MALVHIEAGEKHQLPTLASLASDAVTSALVKTDRFEAVHLFLRAGTRIPPHAVKGYLTLHCLEGLVTFECRRKHELTAGDWLYLSRGEEHGLTAIEDSSLLLGILFDEGRASAPPVGDGQSARAN